MTTPAHLSPQDTWELMQADTSVLLVDVRSDMEYLMIGHPLGSVNVAWIDHPEWTINPQFVPAVRKLMLGRLSGMSAAGRPAGSLGSGTVPVILICRSGNRSLAAAQALIEDGIDDVRIVSGGFEGPLDDNRQRNTVSGWRFAGLPWKQC